MEDGERQIGHARVVTDTASFAYLGDVFVVRSARGQGVGQALIARVLEHPAVCDVRRLTLLTEDAHGLYERFGFEPLDDVRKWMQRRPG